MQIVRYRDGDAARLGLLEGEIVRAAGGELFGQLLPRDQLGPLSSLELLPPVMPGKIVGVGQHPTGTAAPLLFMKPPSSVIEHGAAIVLPDGVDHVQHTAAFGVVIGRRARRVAHGDAYNYILGLTCVSDITASPGEQQSVQAKGYDTFCPLGPAITTDLPTEAMAIEVTVNDVVRQVATVQPEDLDIPYLLEFISGIMTLLPGDLILTGPIASAGRIGAGDCVQVVIPQLGTLMNSVTAESR